MSPTKQPFLVRFNASLKQFVASIWCFPIALTFVLALLTGFQINGSSIGIYHDIFYGDKPDTELLLNHPRAIRSDEWLVTSQMIMAQEVADFARINPNIGDGQDMSLILDVPYREWSVAFKPENLAFFVLPFDSAFAFRWWLPSYLLVLSVYFFVIALFPRKIALAGLLGLGMLFTPFLQWWNLAGTLGSISYSLFGATAMISILRNKNIKRTILSAIWLWYVAVCFVLLLYPPFQIACAISIAAFAVGYILEQRHSLSVRYLLKRLGIIFASLVMAVIVAGAFLITRIEVINTVEATAYPGMRMQQSGGFDVVHLFSGHLQAQLQSDKKAAHYSIPGVGVLNQSEASNFVLLLPFLLIPSVYVAWKRYKTQRTFAWSLIFVNGLFVFLLVWMLLPGIPYLGTFTLLNRVPHGRLLIGLGLLNLLQFVVFAYHYQLLKINDVIKRRWSLAYVAVVFGIELLIGMTVVGRTEDFLQIRYAILFALPVPLAVYALLRRRYVLASATLVLFGISMVWHIHPVYKGTEVLRNTPLIKTIKSINQNNNSAWAVEGITLENLVTISGGKSLSGIYTYPQFDQWKDIKEGKDPEDVYNRYAHAQLAFDRDAASQIQTDIKLISPDSFLVITEPCSDYLKRHGVGYLLTQTKLSPDDSCATLIEQSSYPKSTFYIYKIR